MKHLSAEQFENLYNHGMIIGKKLSNKKRFQWSQKLLRYSDCNNYDAFMQNYFFMITESDSNSCEDMMAIILNKDCLKEASNALCAGLIAEF